MCSSNTQSLGWRIDRIKVEKVSVMYDTLLGIVRYVKYYVINGIIVFSV